MVVQVSLIENTTISLIIERNTLPFSAYVYGYNKQQKCVYNTLYMFAKKRTETSIKNNYKKLKWK